MMNHFKKYWAIWIIHITFIAFFLYSFEISNRMIMFVILLEVIYFLIFFIKNKHNKSSRFKKSVDYNLNYLYIKGILKKITIKKDTIINVTVTKDLLSKVFDWHKMIVVTENEEKIIYVRYIDYSILNEYLMLKK